MTLKNLKMAAQVSTVMIAWFLWHGNVATIASSVTIAALLWAAYWWGRRKQNESGKK